MASARKTFEVQTYSTDHWVLDQCFGTEAEARAHGRRLMANPRTEGYRIVRDVMNATGTHFETEIAVEFRPARDGLQVAPIKDAPNCTTDQEYYGIESRLAITRLLRSYVERTVVTPTEIMHNYGELRRLVEHPDNLVTAAMSRVANVQAGAGDQGKARRDEIGGAVSRIFERTRNAASREDLPELAGGTLSAALERITGSVSKDDLAFFGKVVLCRELVQMRDWFGKLDHLLELLSREGPDPSPLGEEVIDGLVADVLACPSVLPLLLGKSRDLQNELGRLLDLSEGQLPAAQDGPSLSDRFRLLSCKMADMPMVATRFALLDHVRRQIRGAQPLTFGHQEEEEAAFGVLLQRMTRPGGFMGDGGMAEAMVFRYGRFLEAGGATGRRQAVRAILDRYADGRDRLRFLLALAGSEMGKAHGGEISQQLGHTLADESAILGPSPETQLFTSVLENFANLAALARRSDLAPRERERLLDTLDSRMAAWIGRDGVVDRAAPADWPLRQRACRLVALCRKVPPATPKALQALRSEVLTRLRQPDFDRRYAEDIHDPAARLQALRDFHALLDEAGFLGG